VEEDEPSLGREEEEEDDDDDDDEFDPGSRTWMMVPEVIGIAVDSGQRPSEDTRRYTPYAWIWIQFTSPDRRFESASLATAAVVVGGDGMTLELLILLELLRLVLVLIL